MLYCYCGCCQYYDCCRDCFHRWWKWHVTRSRSIFSSRLSTRSLMVATCHTRRAREVFWSTWLLSSSRSKTALRSLQVSAIFFILSYYAPFLFKTGHFPWSRQIRLHVQMSFEGNFWRLLEKDFYVPIPFLAHNEQYQSIRAVYSSFSVTSILS